jgi:hypothetical protein
MVRRLEFAVGGLCAFAVGFAVLAARHASPADSSPVRPSGHWGSVWVVAAVAAFALYGLGILAVRSDQGSLKLAITVAVIIQSLPLAAPLLLSRDVFLYWAESRVVTVHHANPYVVPPAHFPNDPATQIASAQWRTQTESYGPGWVALGSVPTLLAGHSKLAAEWLYRLLAFAGILTAIGLIARSTRSARSVAVLGWSPLIALHYAGGGHSDAWMGVALVVAVAARGTATAGAAWPLGAAIKVVPAVLLPLELARTRLRCTPRFWIGLVGTGVTVVVVSTLAFGTRWATGAAIGAHGTSPIGGVHFLTEAGLRHRYAVAICGLLFVAIYAALLRHAWMRGRARLALAAAALCILSSLLRPWYALWPVALAAVEADGPGELAAYCLSAYVLFADAVSF